MRMTRVIVLFPLVDIDQLAILATRNGRAAGICPALFWWAADEAGGLFGYGGGVVVESGHDQLVILIDRCKDWTKLRRADHYEGKARLDLLWLNRDTMYPVLVHDRPDPIRSVHILRPGHDHDMYRGHHGRFRELPDMQLMY